MSRFSSSAGIAIGPILFVIAILGVLAVTMSSNMGTFSTASVVDRVSADIGSQANLIRAKINECNMMYGTDSNGDGYPASDPINGTLVSSATCTGDLSAGFTSGNLWSGARPSQLPPPTNGFAPWIYANTGTSGGRCFYTTASVDGNSATAAGLAKVATKFSSEELSYNTATSSTTQKFVIFITRPQSTVSALCALP